ncbi:VWA domain-containing protein [Marinobacter oulmenensis]|uniref:Ca-activated chloride channel family protein n=1 Tax=Marinobacter oulmenensis TaxID=643747 RepID=A0A840UET8_9GAMM|nr:VWA domain-containing protein [Marinobacter oulmenensis]MBB5321231.1 Ca-activated chloride channel family protein [Marinobacter oulmenensis]
MTDFHFLRPFWLLLLILLPALPLLRQRLAGTGSGWEKYIPESFLAPLRPAKAEKGRSPQPLPARAILPLLITILSLALAGPVWRQAPTSLAQSDDSLVIALDVSLSMLATDVSPDRLTRAKRKIRDILALRQGAPIALLVYSGDAHVVAPLTDDRRTIEAMLDVLEPTIMPAQGNRADLAINRAVELLEQGAPGSGRILLISDSVAPRYHDSIHTRLADTRWRLDALVAGTPEGSPIPLPKRGFIRDKGDIVIAHARPDTLQTVASNNQGRGLSMTLDDTDIRSLGLGPATSGRTAENSATAQRWQDDGYWLLWLALPLALLGWRRGAVMLVLGLLPVIIMPRPALALDWAGLWQREDQRAPELIRENPDQAARELHQPGWRGSALYRSEQYEQAAEAFSGQPGAIGHYNRGNALARAGKLEQALKAYDQALAQNPELEDARANRELVEDLLRQKEQQQKQQEQQSPADSDSSGEGNQPSPRNNDGETQDQNDADGQSPPDAQPRPPEQAEQPPPEPEGTQPPENPLDRSQEYWLKRIPDNPGGLLERKFLQQYQQRQTEPDRGDTPW